VARLLKWPRDQHEEIAALLGPRRHYSFRLLCCELWLKLHLEGITPKELAEQLVDCASSKRTRAF